MLRSATTDETIRALADPLRRQMVHLLADEPLCTCHLVEMTGARQSNVSNHLRVLREAGLVEAEAAGRFTYYRLRPEALHELAAELGELAGRAESTGAAQAARLPGRPLRRRPCE